MFRKSAKGDPAKNSAKKDALKSDIKRQEPTVSRDDQNGLSAVTSTNSRNMSQPTGYAPSQTQSLSTGQNIDPTDYRVHDSQLFSPGKVVKIRCSYADVDADCHEDGKELSLNDMVKREYSRPGPSDYFVLVRTYPDYSFGVRLHNDDPKNPERSHRLPENQAWIYTDSRQPSPAANGKTAANPPLLINLYKGGELPNDSRLDYADAFTVEHGVPTTFMGEVAGSHWDSFASTCEVILSKISGYKVPRPTLEVENVGRGTWQGTYDKVALPTPGKREFTAALPTDYGRASQTQYRLHGSETFFPGKVVKLHCVLADSDSDSDSDSISDTDTDSDRSLEPLDAGVLLERELSRADPFDYFVLFKTFFGYSEGVRLHNGNSLDPERRPRRPENQALIYTDCTSPSPQADAKIAGNIPILLKLYEGGELPKDSRLDYRETFIVEHGLPVAFMGEVASSHWDYFACAVQQVWSRTLGHDVGLPTSTRDTSRLTYPADDFLIAGQPEPPSGYFEVPGSGRQPGPNPANDLEASPPVTDTYSPERNQGKVPRTSETKRAPIKQNTAGDPGRLGSYGSETPVAQVCNHAETIIQGLSRTLFAGYHGGPGRGSRGLDNESWQMPQMGAITAYSRQGSITCPRDWIDTVTSLGRAMVKDLLQIKPGQTVEQALDDVRARWKISNSLPHSLVRQLRVAARPKPSPKTYIAAPVRVAILDGNIDSKSEVFRGYKTRIKEYKDFVGDGGIPRADTHGMRVASLFLHLAPEADVYIGRAFSDGNTLATAIRHAARVWKVDIISISGGAEVSDSEMTKVLEEATKRDIAIFAATHNGGGNENMAWPARVPYVHPVSASDFYGCPLPSAVPPFHDRLNYCTLGQGIPTFWNEPLARKFRDDRLVRQTVDGSSFAAPIAAAIFATTLLCARLVYDGHPHEPYAGTLETKAVMDGLLKRVSSESIKPKYRYVQPCKYGLLWNDEDLASKYRELVRYVANGVPIP